MIRSQFNYRRRGACKARGSTDSPCLLLFPDPPFRLLFHLCSALYRTDVCGSPSVSRVTVHKKAGTSDCMYRRPPRSGFRRRGTASIRLPRSREMFWGGGSYVRYICSYVTYVRPPRWRRSARHRAKCHAATRNGRRRWPRRVLHCTRAFAMHQAAAPRAGAGRRGRFLMLNGVQTCDTRRGVQSCDTRLFFQQPRVQEGAKARHLERRSARFS